MMALSVLTRRKMNGSTSFLRVADHVGLLFF